MDRNRQQARHDEGDNAGVAFAVRRLTRREWSLLREARLRALADAPYAFGSTFAEEVARDQGWWGNSLGELAWFVAKARSDSDEAAGLIAGLSAADDPSARAGISMWIAPQH